MDDNKKIREVKVVGYSRELLFFQLTILVTIFSLLGVAFSDGWWQTPFVICFLGLFGFSLFQASRLHRRGVTISICDLDEPDEDSTDESDEPEDTEDVPAPDDEPDEEEDADPLDQPHWSNEMFPDPDVELGLKKKHGS
ncbi:MAG: hypothetical protein KAR11_05230 [Phycisphaerae bacterium]|nr:hypothetical protein [Phycisphaerae bacterium]